MSKLASLILCAVSAALPGIAAADPPNLVVNGSFEDNLVPAGSFKVFGPTQVPGWTLSAAVELRHGANGTAKDGVNFAELDAFSNNSISQVLDTVVGGVYELSFWYSNRIAVPVASNGLSFDIGAGAVTLPVLPLNTTGDNAWTQYSTVFTALAPQTTLTFAALGTSDSFGTSLDDVRISGAVPSVPEPSTLALMLAGWVSFAAWQRKTGARARAS